MVLGVRGWAQGLTRKTQRKKLTTVTIKRITIQNKYYNFGEKKLNIFKKTWKFIKYDEKTSV